MTVFLKLSINMAIQPQYTLAKSNIYIIIREEKAPVYMLSRSKAPKNTANLPLQTREKNQRSFFVAVPAIILLT